MPTIATFCMCYIIFDILDFMRLEQLECLCEIVKQGLSVSGAAASLHTSQPAVSRQLRGLERELGLDIFMRNHKRLTGITAPGEAVIAAARRMLAEAGNMRKIGHDS